MDWAMLLGGLGNLLIGIVLVGLGVWAVVALIRWWL